MLALSGYRSIPLETHPRHSSGKPIGSSTQALSASESVAIPKPAAGEYRAVLEGYLNTPTSYEGAAEIVHRHGALSAANKERPFLRTTQVSKAVSLTLGTGLSDNQSIDRLARTLYDACTILAQYFVKPALGKTPYNVRT